MDRGDEQATVHGVAEEPDTIERLNQQQPGSQTPLLRPRSFFSLEELPVLVKQMKTTGHPVKFELQINSE